MEGHLNHCANEDCHDSLGQKCRDHKAETESSGGNEPPGRENGISHTARKEQMRCGEAMRAPRGQTATSEEAAPAAERPRQGEAGSEFPLEIKVASGARPRHERESPRRVTRGCREGPIPQKQTMVPHGQSLRSLQDPRSCHLVRGQEVCRELWSHANRTFRVGGQSLLGGGAFSVTQGTAVIMSYT